MLCKHLIRLSSSTGFLTSQYTAEWQFASRMTLLLLQTSAGKATMEQLVLRMNEPLVIEAAAESAVCWVMIQAHPTERAVSWPQPSSGLLQPGLLDIVLPADTGTIVRIERGTGAGKHPTPALLRSPGTRCR
jgi:hypothetical protein